MKWGWGWAAVSLIAFCLGAARATKAQDNYEIQVYGSDTVEPGHTMAEVHNNFTFEGSKTVQEGMYPTNHQWHETIEITHGFNDWFEVGFYIFTAAQNGHGWDWVGDHIRPRVRVPKKWNCPVGVSISQGFGHQRAQFSGDPWAYELPPIVDKQMGRWYLSFNPTFDKSFHGPSVHQGFTFAPNVKAGYDITKKVNAGFEYYADYGDVRDAASLHDQQQQFFAVTDLNVSPKWEFNFGIGVGTTASTDHLIVKAIVGRRFSW